jgi:hypothetical protein
MHWSEAVRELRARKLELARLDPRGGMPIRPPAGASEDDIARVERRLGRPLPPSYRELLAAQDGWPRLIFGASLLGTLPLSRGTYVDVARMVLSDLDPAPPDGAPAPRGAYVPFALDAEAETLAAWDLDDARADGELGVILVTNDVATRLPDFPSFIELCLDVVCAEIDDRRAAGRRELAAPASLERRSRAA